MSARASDAIVRQALIDLDEGIISEIEVQADVHRLGAYGLTLGDLVRTIGEIVSHRVV